MDEKGQFVVGGQSANTRSRRQLLAIVLAFSLLFFVWLQQDAVSLPRSNHNKCQKNPDKNGIVTYAGEHGLEWEFLGEIDGRRLEHTRLDVPMDQYNATNSGDKTFMIPLIRLRGDEDAKNLLFNPGGPGGSGFEIIHRRGSQLSTIIGKGHHLVSFDPRGVNGSRPQALCYTDKEHRRNLKRTPRYLEPSEDSYEAFAWGTGYVKACLENMGEHGKYINTPQTAADMNTILEALGQEDMIYWGTSYGTALGATYASIFPERSHRVIIDGVVNNKQWYDKSIAEEESLVDAERVLYGFFDECIKAGDDCPLSKHAKSADELQDKVLRIAFDLKEPLSVYLNTTHWGMVQTQDIIITALFPALYRPPMWWTVADRLSKLLDGNATEAFLAYGGNSPFAHILDDEESNDFVTYNDAQTGPNNFPHTRQALVELVKPFYNSSLFAPADLSAIFKKAQWAVPKTHDFKQPDTVKTKHPLLVLSTSYDPVCPLISAKKMRDVFQGSQVVELQAYGHCSVAVPSNCMAKYIRAFLYNGTVPAEHSYCDMDGPYYIKPNATALLAQKFEDEDDKAIYEAQRQLALDDSWPYIRRW